MTEQPYIIRSRISQKMAFPVGYELLRDHFGAIGGWTEARFHFSAHPTTFASEFTDLLRDRVPYRILRVERLQDAHTPRYVPAHWCFTVYPVEHDLKSIARAALVDQSFEALRCFMPTVPTHAHSYNRMDVIFDPTEGTCRTEQLWET